VWYGGHCLIVYERQLPTGEWVSRPHVFPRDCAAVSRLAPGERKSLGRFEDETGPALREFVEKKGDVNALPARISVRIWSPAKNPDGSESSALVHSEPIMPAR